MKLVKKAIVLLLIVIMTVTPLASCSSQGKALMRFRDTEISTNMFSYMISSQKSAVKAEFDYYNALAYQYYGTYYYGTNDFDAFINQEQELKDGGKTTIAKELMDMIINSAKTYVIVNELCKRFNLEITDESTITAVEERLKDDIDYAGNEDFLNILLSEYGADLDIEREFLYSTKRHNVLSNYLYGENGTQRIADELVKEDFRKNYNKFDCIRYDFYDVDQEKQTQIIKKLDITDDEKKEYFDNNYTKIEHILFYYIDVTTTDGKLLNDEQKAAKKKLAEEVYGKLKNGDLTFDDAQNEYNEDKGFDKENDGVCFGKGDLDNKLINLENEALKINVDDISLVETEIGVHIIKRMPLTDSDYTEEIKKLVNDAMVITRITEQANDFYEKLKDGSVTMTETDLKKHDSYGAYYEATVYTKGQVSDALQTELDSLENIGDTAVFADETGVYIVRKLKLEDSDITDAYADVYDKLADEAFQKYVESFYAEIEIDEEELAKYDFSTAKILNIATLDENSETPVN